MTTSAASTIDVRQIAPSQRHALIFSTFAALESGQALQLVNDHDPQPLKQQFQLRSPGQFSWEYLEAGPQVWRVQIGKTGTAVSTAGNCCSGGACCG